MLETDQHRVLEAAEFARKAIQDRVAELNRDPLGSTHERKYLREALNYLAMLLDCSRKEGGAVLWS
jgi:hypothetical protein